MDRWLNNITVVRIIAPILAILLWAVVHFDENPPTGSASSPIQTMPISNVKVTLESLDTSQFKIKSMDPALVNLTLTGKQSNLNKVNTLDYKIQADLSAVHEGTHSLPLQAVGFPSGVQVQMNPSSISITIEKMNKKEVPVSILLKGEPANGYIAGEPIVRPNRVNVTLSTSMLDQVDSVSAELDISGASGPVEKEVKLQAYDVEGKKLDIPITPSVVDVEVPITNPFVSMPLKVRFTGEPEEGYSVAGYIQEVNEVTVYGPEEVLSELEFYDGLAVDINQLNDDADFTLDIPLKNGVIQVQPSELKVTVDIEPAVTKTLDNVPLSISGQNQNYNTVILDHEEGLDIQIRGAANLVEPLNIEDVQAIADVSNLPPGQYDIPVTLNLPNFVKQAPEEPYSIQVEISSKSIETQTEPTSETPLEEDTTEAAVREDNDAIEELNQL